MFPSVGSRGSGGLLPHSFVTFLGVSEGADSRPLPRGSWEEGNRTVTPRQACFHSTENSEEPHENFRLDARQPTPASLDCEPARLLSIFSYLKPTAGPLGLHTCKSGGHTFKIGVCTCNSEVQTCKSESQSRNSKVQISNLLSKIHPQMFTSSTFAACIEAQKALALVMRHHLPMKVCKNAQPEGGDKSAHSKRK